MSKAKNGQRIIKKDDKIKKIKNICRIHWVDAEKCK